MLDANSRLIRQLALERAWGTRVIRELEIGFDGARITIPIRDGHDDLRGVLRYDPFGRRDPKMLAVPGTRLGLIPHPAREASDRIILVEGPPDMVAARSSGLARDRHPGHDRLAPVVGPAAHGPARDGRHGLRRSPAARAAGEIADSLRAAAIPTDVVDLWPDRHDGYDLTDRILERRRTRTDPRAPARSPRSCAPSRPSTPTERGHVPAAPRR